MSKKVLILPDRPDWALDKNARDLVKYNKSDLELDVCYFNDFENDWENYYKQYDLIFPMYIGSFFALLKKRIPTQKVITGIRSYHRWDKKKTVPPGYNSKPSRKTIRELKKAVLLNTHCKKLWYVFAPYLRIIHTKYTCDLEKYFPENKKVNGKLVVGWTGSLTNHGNKRGFHDFIKPICDELPNVELRTQTKEDNFVTDENQMREFYNSLDLYICASRTEGTPRPVIEAAACGVPIISTDVGIVPELIENNDNGWIVDRNYDAIKSKLDWLSNNREILPGAGRMIREKMEKDFNWECLIHQWTDFFEYSLELIKLKNEKII